MGILHGAEMIGREVIRSRQIGTADGWRQYRQGQAAGDHRTVEHVPPIDLASVMRGAGDVTDSMAADPSSAAPGEREYIDGLEMIKFARAWLGRLVAFPTPEMLDLVTVWAIHAAARDALHRLIWRASPRLLVTSKGRQCGKSTLLNALTIMLGVMERTSSVSPAALAETLGGDHQPVFLDEAGLMFGSGNASQQLQRLLLDGYTPMGVYKVKGTKFSTFGPVVWAGKRNLVAMAQPDTALGDLVSRSFEICLLAPDVRPPAFDQDAEAFGALLAEALPGWCAQERDALLARAKELGSGGESVQGSDLRDMEIAVPLRAVVDVIGGDWPKRLDVALHNMNGGGTVMNRMRAAAAQWS